MTVVGSSGLRQWLIRVTTGNFLMKVVSTALGFFSTLSLARLLSPEQYGGYAYALAWVNLLVVPVVLGMDKLTVRSVSVFVSERAWPQLRGIARFSRWLVGGAGVVVAFILWGGIQLGLNEENRILLEPLQVAAFLIPLIAVNRVRAAIMIGLQHVIAGLAPEQILRPVLFIAAIWAGFRLLDVAAEARNAVIMNILAMSVAFVVGGMLLRRVMPADVAGVTPSYRPGKWLRGALPLALLAGLQVLNSRIDLVMLGMLRGPVEVALYNIVSLAATLTSFVLVAAGGVVAPVVARLYAQKEQPRLQRLVTSSSRAIFFATLPIAASMLAFGDLFLSLFGEQYGAGYPALAVLVAGQLANAAFGSVGVLLTMTDRGGLAAKGAAVGVVANVFLNIVLIPPWGVVGAAIASMVTLFLWNLIFAFYVYKEIGIRPTVVG